MTSSRRRGWWAGVAVLALVVVAGVGLLGVFRLREPLPPPTMQLVLPPTVRVAGAAPAFPWPTQGQAALVVEGVGTAGVHGPPGPIAVGSVAKVMTALVVLHDHPLAGEAAGPSLAVTTADEHAYARVRTSGDSLLRVVAGERISERQALEALMVPSADNIADLLARWDAGSIPAFVVKMNRQARAWGATHTHYDDASGLSSATTSTATDQVRVGERALRQPVLAAIMAERKADLPVEGSVSNYNSLLGSDGVVGIKTGSTRAAGGNLLFAARTRIGGRSVTLVGAVLGQAVGTPPLSALKKALAASRALVRYAAGSLRLEQVLRPGQLVSTGRTAWGQPVVATTAADLALVAFRGQVLRLTVEPCRPSAPAAAGTPCGSIATGWGDALSGRSAASVKVRLANGVVAPPWTWRLLRRSAS